MKIRIQRDSVRIRLSRKEVEQLCTEGLVAESTYFGNSSFGYAVSKTLDSEQLAATFSNNQITVLVPSHLLSNWITNDVIGFEASMPTGETRSLYILVEKDFKCLDNTTEDQSDNYDNPHKTC